MPQYEPVSKASAYLTASQQSRNLCQSPLDSIIDQLMDRDEEKPICTIRKTPKHSTYIYRPSLLPIAEYPRLEEFAVHAWVNTGCRTKEGIVKEWGCNTEIPASLPVCNKSK